MIRGNNLSDTIENYLKSRMLNERYIEVQRSELAEMFSVVPSQINYVIKTRFNLHTGYSVESKRGGAGYIRIHKISFVNDQELLDQIATELAHGISEMKANKILDNLVLDNIINNEEKRLLSAIISEATIGVNKETENVIRGRIIATAIKTKKIY